MLMVTERETKGAYESKFFLMTELGFSGLLMVTERDREGAWESKLFFNLQNSVFEGDQIKTFHQYIC